MRWWRRLVQWWDSLEGSDERDDDWDDDYYLRWQR